MQWVVILYLVTPKSIFFKKVLLYKGQIFDSAVVLQDIKYMTILSIDSLKKKKKIKEMFVHSRREQTFEILFQLPDYYEVFVA